MQLMKETTLMDFDDLQFYIRQDTSDLIVCNDNIKAPYYKHLDSGGKWLDLGGYIGTSACVFLQHGADMVFSVEADPTHVILYEENLRLNGHTPNILCAAVTKVYDDLPIEMLTVNVRDGNYNMNVAANTLFPKWKTKRTHIPVPVITFEEIVQYIVNMYGKEQWSAKFDIEGAEIDILLSEDLSMFQQLYIEYHLDINPDIATAKRVIFALKEQGFIVHQDKELPDVKTWEWWPARLTLWCVKDV